MSERRLASFISTFVSTTERFGSPAIFRRWTAISILSGALRQNVWVLTSRPLYANTYIFIMAHPGVGKTRIIIEARHMLTKVKGIHIAPISMTFASLIDALAQSKVELIKQPQGLINYNSMYITADELGAFVHKYDNEMMAGLTALYDPTPYRQTRRTGGKGGDGIDIEITSPQLNFLVGSTPQNLISWLPDLAWGQGFMSRVIMVFSDQRSIIDDFADHGPPMTEDLIHDLELISGLYGRFHVTDEYRRAVNDWKSIGEGPLPSHPRLIHYVTRRRVHVYKLSMIASVDRSSDLTLTEADFFTALEWLMAAESVMADVFKAGATNADAQAMEEIVHWIKVTDLGTGVSEQRIVQFASERIAIQSITRIIEILENTGQIQELRRDRRTFARYFCIAKPEPTAQ